MIHSLQLGLRPSFLIPFPFVVIDPLGFLSRSLSVLSLEKGTKEKESHNFTTAKARSSSEAQEEGDEEGSAR